MIRQLALALIAAAPLAACGSGDGTSISINASGNDGDMAAGVDHNGQLAINLPGGFAGNIKLPKLKLDADDFDMNGVKLFPGSTISNLNIDARDGPEFEDKDGSVHLSFDAPADPATVRDWFRKKLTAAGYKLSTDGNGLTGTTDDKQSFRLELAPAGASKSNGSIAIGG